MMRIALIIFIAKTLMTSFEYRENNPTALFPYYYAVDDYSSGNVSNPAYLPYLGYGYISTSYSQPYSMGDINASSMRLGYGMDKAGYQASWSRFGIDEYREDVLEGNIGYNPGKYLLAGLGISGYRLCVKTENYSFSQSLLDFRASLILIPFQWINLGFHQENINSLIDEQREDILYPGSSFGIMLKPVQGISLLWNINGTYYGYVNSFSISINLLQSLNLRTGYSRETSTYAASFMFIYRLITVSYGLRHHPFLGSTHCLGVSLSTRTLSLERVAYRTRLPAWRSSDTIRKIDINACSVDDLKRIPSLSDGIAERIIKYRNVIGPISRKSLLQVGMSSKEVRSLQRYIFGFASDSVDKQYMKTVKPHRSKRKYRRGAPLKKRRELFRKLIESGIRASIALSICEHAGKVRKKSLATIIDKLPEISNSNKRLILKICTDTL
jgi:hypothetical protein